MIQITNGPIFKSSLYSVFSDDSEFELTFGMSLQGDCHEVGVTPYLELLVTFGMSLEGVCHELYT